MKKPINPEEIAEHERQYLKEKNRLLQDYESRRKKLSKSTSWFFRNISKIYFYRQIKVPDKHAIKRIPNFRRKDVSKVTEVMKWSQG